MTMEHNPRVPSRLRAPKVQDNELEPIRRFDASGKEIYEAFRVSPRREEHLEIRLASESWQFPRFLDMANIIPDQREGTKIALFFPTCAIFIAGKNLVRLVYALKAHRCAFIEQYREDIFAPVEDEDAPFIGLIELKMR